MTEKIKDSGAVFTWAAISRLDEVRALCNKFTWRPILLNVAPRENFPCLIIRRG